MNANEQHLTDLLRRIERLVRNWPHLAGYVEKIVSDTEQLAQNWPVRR